MKTSNFTPEQLGASADGALGAVTEAGANGPALVDAWIETGNAAAVQAVAESAQGPARKTARRGMNVLKARGVAVPAAHRKGRLASRSDSSHQAWLLPPDSTGTEALVLAESQPSGSYQACFVFFREG